MQFLVIAIASLATLAAATPPPPVVCKPGTYSCTPNNQGWRVCSVSKQWVYAGACPPDTVCKFYPLNASPYCVPADFQF